ncbi:MAG TPA: hypothetical protein VMD98_11460 [Bryocella sp.]|nr:hypothetical protein [Bryocella sp.]
MTRRIAKPSPSNTALIPVLRMGVRAIWSRVTSIRADVKLAPCMARPNLFSGD